MTTQSILLKPVWVGRFEVNGPRDHQVLEGYPAARVWVAAQADDAETLRVRVESAMTKEGLTVTKGESVEQVVDDLKLPLDVRKLLREARRQPGTVVCGKWHKFEHFGAHRPTFLELKTERLLLRPWHRKDRDPFARMNADRDVMTYSAAVMTRRQSDEEVDRYLAAFDREGFSILVAEDRATKAFAGVMGLQVMRDVVPNLPQPAVEIGWRLSREFQGKGLATEGGRAILNLAFHDFQLMEVVGTTAVANAPCRHVMEKLGMTHRADLDLDHPRMPPKHIYRRFTLYQLQNPNLGKV